MRYLGWTSFAIAVVLALAWCAAALHFTGPRPALLADGLAAALVLAGLVVLVTVRPFGRTLTALVVLFAVWALWWIHVAPRNDRDWQPDVARTSHVDVDGDRLTFHDVRDFDYRSETDYTERWENRTLDLSKLTGMDLFMSYWGAPGIAHTIMSWEFTDGQHLAVSIETRKEKGEEYSAVKGFFKQFEIYYVVADERDVIRLRTNYRGEEVHLWQLRTPISRARRILLDYVKSINELHARPQWYNAATQNCTTSITRHIRKLGIPFPLDWRVIANGRLDEMLYERGVVDTSRPFPEVRQATLVNARAKAADQDPAFSARIRDGLTRPPLIVLPAGTD
ncbi:MAG: DUF4105 domain-containing protein [Deltaproteobacteria bacterium]|nr:DUF4105 domain-containing protein [Deltaproteobacteria bacterium]